MNLEVDIRHDLGSNNSMTQERVGEFMLMSMMGWTNPNQARKYIEKASRAKMAGKGMQMLDEEQT